MLTRNGELTDHYMCMLFNDEVHTYEQVYWLGMENSQITTCVCCLMMKFTLISRYVD